MAEVKSSAAAFGNLMSLTLIFWMTHSVRAEPGVRAEWNALSRHIHRILFQQTDFPLLSVCFDQWPLPRELNATKLQMYGSPCPDNTWYYACCNDALNCFAWSSSTQALACNSYQPNCCSTPSNNYTGKMVFPPRPGIPLKAKHVKWSEDLTATQPSAGAAAPIPRSRYIIGACIGGAAMLAVIVGLSITIICMLRKSRAAAAVQVAQPMPSMYAPAIPQPWTSRQGQSPSPVPGLTPTYSAGPMLRGRRSEFHAGPPTPGGAQSSTSGLMPAYSAEPMLRGRRSEFHTEPWTPSRAHSGAMNLAPAYSAEPMLRRSFEGSSLTPVHSVEIETSGLSTSSGLSSARSTEPMLPWSVSMQAPSSGLERPLRSKFAPR